MPALVLGAPRGGGRRQLVGGRAGGAVLGGEDEGDLPAEDLRLGVPQDAPRAVVPAGHAAGGVGHEDGEVLDPLDQQAEAILALAQGPVGPAVLGDVGEDGDGTDGEVGAGLDEGVDHDPDPAVPQGHLGGFPAAGSPRAHRGPIGAPRGDEPEQLAEGAAEQLGAGLPQERLGGAVAAGDGPVVVQQADAVADGVEGGLPLVGRAPRGVLGAADPQQRPDRGDQDRRLDGLREVGVGPPLQPPDLVVGVDPGGRDVEDRDGGRGRVGLDPAADLEAADVRQVDVQDDQVGPPRHQAQRRGAVGRLDGGEARVAEDPVDGVALRLVVVDDQDRCGVRVSHGPPPRAPPGRARPWPVPRGAGPVPPRAGPRPWPGSPRWSPPAAAAPPRPAASSCG